MIFIVKTKIFLLQNPTLIIIIAKTKAIYVTPFVLVHAAGVTVL